MKKITTLFSALLISAVGFQSQAQIYLQENFDVSIPGTWTIIDGGAATGDSWISGMQGGTNSLDGTNGVIVDSDANGNGVAMIETLESPIVNTTGATALFLEFDQYFNSIGGDVANVDVFDGTTWVNVLTQAADIGSFATPDHQTIDITALSNANLQVRFFYDDGNVWAWYWMVDNVLISNISCPAPTAPTAINILTTSADLGWTENGSATTWDIEWGAQGFIQGAGTMVTGTTTNPHNLTGLAASTSYDYYVRADCGGSQSAWTGPYTFTTACVTFIAPFTETFDAATTPNCWSQSLTTGSPWVFGALGATGYASAIFDDHTGNAGNFAWVDFSGGGNDVGVILESPNVDVSALPNTSVSFWLASYNTDNNDSNVLFVEAWNGSTWDVIASIQQDSSLWVEYTFDITASVSGGIAKVRFRAELDPIGTSFFYNDLLIDDINIDAVIGINELTANVASIYPNPTTNVVNVSLANFSGSVNYSLHSIDGRLVRASQEVTSKNFKVDLSNESNGIYFLRINDSNAAKTYKVIKR